MSVTASAGACITTAIGRARPTGTANSSADTSANTSANTTADDRADLFGAPLAEIARDQYRDAHGKLRHHKRDKVEHLTARGDGGESRGRAEPPDDEQVDGAVDCLQNQRAEDGEHKEAELTQNAALRSISLTVRVTPGRGICQALLTDAAYEVSGEAHHRRHRRVGRRGQSGRKTALAMLLGCGIGWVCGFTGSGGGILMLTVSSLVLGYNLKVAVGTSTMIMTLVALTGAVSHISLGARIFPLPMAVMVLSCLLGAVVSAKFANRCEIARLNRIVGIVLALLGIVTIAVKLL